MSHLLCDGGSSEGRHPRQSALRHLPVKALLEGTAILEQMEKVSSAAGASGYSQVNIFAVNGLGCKAVTFKV